MKTMMKKIIRAALLWVLCCHYVIADTQIETLRKGISFYVLRVIYPEIAIKGVTIKADNKTDSPYLFQSFIRPVDSTTGDVDLNDNGLSEMPFIVTPPLTRIEPLQTLNLRIRRTGLTLPSDRESVFYISMKAIPAMDNSSKSGAVIMTVVTNMKIFYRPKGIENKTVSDVASELKFSIDEGFLIAKNPSPYWLTFSTLKVGGQVIDKKMLRKMVPPFGSQKYSLPKEAKGDISWTLIDEDGWNTIIYIQSNPLM